MTELDNATLFYISAGMLATWFVQVHSLRFKQASRFLRMREAFVCSLFTAAVSLPLLDFYPRLPSSICLIVGAVMGTIGLDGWGKLANMLVQLFTSNIEQLSGEKFDQSKTQQKKDNDNESKQ